MITISIFYIFITALMTSLVMVMPISHLAVRIGGIDKPDDRKVHSSETPRLGGIAIFCSFLFTVLLFQDIDRQTKAFLIGAVVIFLTGLADDITGLSPRNKLIGEIFAASLAILSGGISIKTLGNPLGLGEIGLGLCAIPFTIFAVVGVMNAINLIDGLDGLAGGASAVACLALGILSWKVGNINLLALMVALLGSIMGFLRFNTFPAKIFMGDSGSLFLGYCMGFFSVLLLNSSGSTISPVAPLMILGVPVLDTLVVMGARKLNGKSISSPDKTHIHHRLLELGIGHRFSVLLVYGLSYSLAVFALLLHGSSDSTQALLLVAFSLVLYTALHIASTSNIPQQFSILKSNITIRERKTSRLLVKYSRFLFICIKYLILLITVLVLFVKPDLTVRLAWISGLLLVCMSVIMMIRREWGDSLLQTVIYLSGVVIIFIIENYGRQTELAGYKIVWFSHTFFTLLFVIVGIKIVLRMRGSNLITTPFEYLILFVVVAVPLLPVEITSQFHLMSVAAKSVILFVSYKLILMRHMRRNRKVLATTYLALFALVLRYALQ